MLHLIVSEQIQMPGRLHGSTINIPLLGGARGGLALEKMLATTIPTESPVKQKSHFMAQISLIQTFFVKFISSEISSAFAEWVIAPMEILSMPVSATWRTFSSVILPEASVRGLCGPFQPFTRETASCSRAASMLSNRIMMLI